MAVGNFPGLGTRDRRTIKAPVNPLDKSTVVSILPKEIIEVKPTLQPGKFVIPAGRYDNPAILVVTPSSWWKDIDPDQPLLEIPHSSIVVANSIVIDYCNGLFCCNMGDVMPGLFYIPGERTQAEVLSDYQPQLDAAVDKQTKWFKALVKAGDILWARSSGNPLSIDDNTRIAAGELNLSDKPWLKDFATMQLNNCPACGQLRDENYPVCQHCKTVIDKAAYERLEFTSAS